MNKSFDIWSLLLAFGALQGIMLLPPILKGKNIARFFLAALVLIMTINVLDYLFLSVKLFTLFPHFLFISQPLLFLIGPCYYFYVKSITDPNFKFRAIYLLHGLIFIGAVIYHWPFYELPWEVKQKAIISYLNSDELTPDLPFIIYISVHVVQTIVYIFLAGQALSGSRELVEKRINGKKFYQWIRKFNVGFATYWLINFAWLMWLTAANDLFHEVDYIVVLSNALAIVLLSYIAISKNGVFHSVFLGESKTKYNKSTLSGEQSKTILSNLLELMNQRKPYLDPDLKLNHLASELSVSANNLSQVLNNELDKNFYEFINDYRLKEVKQRLTDPNNKHLTIFGIALDAGFNNKNSFNRFFKQNTGLTPSKFLKNNVVEN